jgi:hypothetical protein
MAIQEIPIEVKKTVECDCLSRPTLLIAGQTRKRGRFCRSYMNGTTFCEDADGRLTVRGNCPRCNRLKTLPLDMFPK